MYLVAIGWMYVVLMMTVAEAMSPQGTVLGAAVTFVFYGVLPVTVLMYILGTPARARARRKAELAEREAALAAADGSAAPPDGSGQSTGDAVAPEGKKV